MKLMIVLIIIKVNIYQNSFWVENSMDLGFLRIVVVLGTKRVFKIRLNNKIYILFNLFYHQGKGFLLFGLG